MYSQLEYHLTLTTQPNPGLGAVEVPKVSWGSGRLRGCRRGSGVAKETKD